MSRKISAARRAAFFDALGETGNRTLAAEAAKVSQSWVSLHRARDPAFRSEMEEALRHARDRLGAHGERRPPSGWGFLDGEELVVRGSRGRRVQVARARLRQITPRVEERFLAVLAATCNVKAACVEAGVSFGAMYAHRKRWTAFARRWDDALALGSDLLALALVQHAANPFSGGGLPEPAAERRLGFDDALHNLYMHQHRLWGRGGQPGRAPGPASIDDACARIAAAIDAVDRGEALDGETKARAEAEYARRRPSREED